MTAVAGIRSTPAAAAAQLRAIQCCADHCHREDPFSAARRCCLTSADAHHVAATSAAPGVNVPPAAAVSIVVACAQDPGRGVAVESDVPSRAGPLYLRIHALRC
jgi:hypothetical protein